MNDEDNFGELDEQEFEEPQDSEQLDDNASPEMHAYVAQAMAKMDEGLAELAHAVEQIPPATNDDTPRKKRKIEDSK